MSPFLLLAALVPAAFLMVQVYRLDRIEKEPAGLLLKLVLFGALSGLAAGAIEGALTRVLDVTLGGGMLRLVLENFLAVALVEEACKRWVVLKFAWNHPAFDYRFDAVVYCVFSALGFAALENILYVAEYGFAVAVSRALLSVPGHCFFAVYMGIYLGQAKMAERAMQRYYIELPDESPGQYLRASLLVPALLHGFWDFSLSVGGWLMTVLFYLFVLAFFIDAYRKLRFAAGSDERL
mgnify:FL=1